MSRKQQLYPGIYYLIFIIVILVIAVLGFIRLKNQVAFTGNSQADVTVKSDCSIISPDKMSFVPNVLEAKENTSLLKNSDTELKKLQQSFDNAKNDAKLEASIKSALNTRKKYLISAMRLQPEAALQSIQEHHYDDLQVKNNPGCIEKFISVTGTMYVYHADFFKERLSKTQYILRTNDGKKIFLHPGGGLHIPLISGMSIQVRGYLLDNELVFSGINKYDLKVLPSKQLPVNAFGAQNTLVVKLNFGNVSELTQTPQALVNMVFGNVNDYFKESSYTQMSVPGTIQDIKTYARSENATCDLEALATAAIQSADSEVDFRNYERIVIRFQPPYDSPCNYGGAASIGKMNFSSGDGDVLMSVVSMPGQSPDFHTYAHEVGHSIGLDHSHYLRCSNIASINCTETDEYGDIYDVMGLPPEGAVGHSNASQKEYLGWLGSSRIQTVTNEGDYVIKPLETNLGFATLKIPRPATRAHFPFQDFLYVEYRQPIGFDQAFNGIGPTNVFQGALLHIHDQALDYNIFGKAHLTSALLNANYLNESLDVSQVALMKNQSYTDPATGKIITVTDVSSEGLTVHVSNGDTPILPTISFVNPVNNAQLHGRVNFSMHTTAEQVQQVHLIIDDARFSIYPALITRIPLFTSNNDEVNFEFDTRQLFNGEYSMKAIAYARSGGYSTATIRATIQNEDAAPFTVLNPSHDQAIMNPIYLYVSRPYLTREIPIESYSFVNERDEVLANISDQSVPVTLPVGNHTLHIVGKDVYGNVHESSPISVHVVNQLPTPTPLPFYNWSILTHITCPDGSVPLEIPDTIYTAWSTGRIPWEIRSPRASDNPEFNNIALHSNDPIARIYVGMRYKDGTYVSPKLPLPSDKMSSFMWGPSTPFVFWWGKDVEAYADGEILPWKIDFTAPPQYCVQ